MPTSSSKTAVAIRHVGFEDLGTFHHVLAAHGFEVRLLDAATDEVFEPLRDADLGIVLGGPMGANDDRSYPVLTRELAALRARLDVDAPTLGVCLGAQLIARALGARVYRGKAPEIGWSHLELTPSGVHSPLLELRAAPVLHWHSDTFDLPSGARLLAGTARYAHQAFAWGRATLALQFHAEVVPALVEHWLIGHAVELAKAELEPSKLRAATNELPGMTARAGARMLGSWLDSIGQ